jgi:hypothetical protein
MTMLPNESTTQLDLPDKSQANCTIQFRNQRGGGMNRQRDCDDARHKQNSRQIL